MKLWNVDHSVKRRCREIHTEDAYSGRGITYPLNFGDCQEENAISKKSISEIGNPYISISQSSYNRYFKSFDKFSIYDYTYFTFAKDTSIANISAHHDNDEVR